MKRLKCIKSIKWVYYIAVIQVHDKLHENVFNSTFAYFTETIKEVEDLLKQIELSVNLTKASLQRVSCCKKS